MRELYNKLSYLGTTNEAQAIIQGECPTEWELAPNAKTILNKLSDNGRLPRISTLITSEEFTNSALRNWAEKTTKSPSGRHLGHYKILLNDNLNYREEKDNLINERILQVYYFIMAAAINSGNILDRWKHVMTAMIEKIPGSPKIDKLRVIHLNEADYNLLLTILWARKLVWNAHNHNAINDYRCSHQ